MRFILYAEQSFRYHEMVGGYMCFLELANELANMGHEVACAVMEIVPNNNLFNRLIEYRNNKFGRSNFLESYTDINIYLKNSIAIYGESVKGNPMRAPKVVRLIACELGIHNGTWHYNFWDKDDRVYFFNKEKRFDETRPDVYKMLNVFHLNNKFRNISEHGSHRKLACHFFKKIRFYGDDLVHIHPATSVEIFCENIVSYDAIKKVFGTYKYFFCYDPCSFLPYLAALCGCTAIVAPIKGMTKREWLTKHSSFKKIENVFGVAWGLEDVRWARRTRKLLEFQIATQVELARQTVHSFVDDMMKWDECRNTPRNIFTYHPNIYCLGTADPVTVKAIHGNDPGMYIVGNNENGDYGVYQHLRSGHNCGFYNKGPVYMKYLTTGENKIIFSIPHNITIYRYLIDNAKNGELFYFSPVKGCEKYNEAVAELFRDRRRVLHQFIV